MSREERCECCGNEHGCCLRFREGWTPASIYRPGDAVPLAGSSYIAIHPNQNDKPPSPNWALIAAKGDAGPPGPPDRPAPPVTMGRPVSPAYLTLTRWTAETSN